MTGNAYAIENMDTLNNAARELKAVIKRYEYEFQVPPDLIERCLNMPDEWDTQTVKDEWEAVTKTVLELLDGCHAEKCFLFTLWGFNVEMSLLRVNNVEEKAKRFYCALAGAVTEIEQEKNND